MNLHAGLTSRPHPLGALLHLVCGCFVALLLAQPAALAEQILLDEADIFFGGEDFVEGDVEIVNGKIVLRNGREPAKEAEANDASGTQVLELTDGSRIHGKLVSFGRSEVVWERSDANGPLIFSPDEVRRFVLGKEQAPDPKSASAALKLDGSDWVTGELMEMKNGKFVLQVGPDTRIDIERSKVEWFALSPAGPAPDAYEGPIGPMGLAGWDMAGGGPGSWDYVDGALVAKTPAPLTRSFTALPELVDIEFTAGDGGNSNRGFALWIRPGASRPQGYTKGAYYLRFQASTVQANYYTGEEMKNFSANFPQDKEEKKMTRYRLLMDRKAGRLVVHANGKQVADWDLPNLEDVPSNASLTWQPTHISNNMAWTLSNVRVRPWDGSTDPDAKGDDAAKDSLAVKGGERKSGVLDAITAENIKFSGAEISRKAPMFLRLGRKSPSEPPENAVARVWLASRGEFDVTAIGYKEGRLRVRTSFGGELTLPGTALRGIEFPHKLAVVEKGAVESGDRLIFKNGDRLRGSLIGSGNNKPLQWEPMGGGKPVEFAQGRIAGVLLGSRVDKNKAPPDSAGTSAAVRFQNGDWLPGKLLSLDAGSVRLKASICDELKIARPNVTTLYIGHGEEAPVWDGASGRLEWTKAANIPGFSGRNMGQHAKPAADPWHYLDGSFTLHAPSGGRYANSMPGLARVLKALPKKVDVSFDLHAPRGGAGYSIQLFFEENKPGFMVQGGWDSAYFYDMSPRQQGGVFFNQPQQIEFGEKVGTGGEKRTFRFLADRDTGHMWMYVNSQLVGSIGRRGKTTASNPKNGTGIAIMPRPMQSQVTVSNIWIAPWSGVLPAAATASIPGKGENKNAEGTSDTAKKPPAEEKAPPAPATPPQDSVALANGDETLGTVLGATPDSLKLQCEVGELEIPLKRTSLIEFANKPIAPAKGVRFRFVEKGAITVESFTIENGKVTCRSAAAGEMTFPLSAVSEIVWVADVARALKAMKTKPAENPLPPARN